MQAALIGPSGQIILESTVFTIGSSPDNSLVIDNLKVSAHHAEICPEEQGFSITDLGSIHGTYVNGERLDFKTPHMLNHGNSIAIGDMVFTYEVEEMPQTEQAPSTSPNQEVDSGAPSDENAEMLLSPVAHEMGLMSGPSGNQQLIEATTSYTLPQQYMPSYPQQMGYVPMIPAGYVGPIPGYVPIEQVRRSNRRLIWIGLGGLVVIALVIFGYIYFTRSTPEKTLDIFCNAMRGQDYQTAFNQLSPSLQSSETELEFAHTSQAGGKVSACTHSPATTTSNLATANVTLVTGPGQTSNTTVTLMTDSGNTWKITMLPTSPAMTLTAFCNALRSRDYPTAYTQLSSRIRRLNAEAQFETDFTGLTCSYSTVSPSGNTASTTVLFRNASGQTANAPVSLIQDSNNNWKIDSI
jgi:pSer/pThr/pTyr-binding forkhead associated (FHA) protein/limonene-1,2-epoxide hydrolase